VREGEHEQVDSEITRLAVPAMLQGFLFTIVFVVDTIMVARLGAPATAAVGVAGAVVWSVSSVLFALFRGTVALVAHRSGARDIRGVRSSAGQSLSISLLIGVGSGLVLWSCRRAILAPFGLDSQVFELASRYLGIVGFAFVAAIPAHVLKSIFQAAGDTRTPLAVSAIGNVVNIVGDYVLIYGVLGAPALGVEGAAWATAICRVTEFALLAVLLGRRFDCPGWHDFVRPSRRVLRILGRIGWPALAEALVFHSGYVAFCFLIAKLGTIALAAHSICMSIESLAFMPCTGLAVAASTHAGQCLGAKRSDLAEYGLLRVCRRTVTYMSIIAVVLAIGAPFFVALYTGESDVSAQAVLCLRIIALEVVPLGLAMSMMGMLQGAGDTRSPLLVTALGIWLLRVPGTALIGPYLGYGLAGVYVVTVLDWVCRACLMRRAVLSGRWKSSIEAM